MTIIIQIGFNKCATRSIKTFFSKNGFKGVHWKKGALANDVFKNLTNGYPLLMGYKGYRFFSDMEFVTKSVIIEAYKFFPIFAEQYSDAVFILNTRDKDEWLKSRFRHNNGAYAKKWMSALKLKSEDDLENYWSNDFDRHHERVRKFFSQFPERLIEYDIDSDPVSKLFGVDPSREFKYQELPVVGRTKPEANSASQIV